MVGTLDTVTDGQVINLKSSILETEREVNAFPVSSISHLLKSKSSSETSEVLVPIRLDFESDKYRLHDTFTWNLNEKNVSVAQFAENLVEDFDIPQNVSSNIASIISDQIKEFDASSIHRHFKAEEHRY